MACCRIVHVILILSGVFHGRSELHCKQEDCGESTSKYKAPYEQQSTVEETPYMISPEDFYYKFVAEHKPLIMREAVSNWPANKVRNIVLFF